MSESRGTQRVQEALPEGLEAVPPGPRLSALLATVHRADLDDGDRLRLARARNRQVSHEQAQLMADLYAVTWDEPDEIPESRQSDRHPWAQAEVAFALTWTTFAAGNRLEQARQLIEDLPVVQAALVAGDIDMPKALLICDEVSLVDVALARTIVDKVIEIAPRLTTGQLRSRLRRLLAAADRAAIAARARAKVIERRVGAHLDHHHLASLSGYDLAPHRVAAAWERLTAIARAAKAEGDTRRIDQLRADAFLDLLTGDGIAHGGVITDGGLPAETLDAGPGPHGDHVSAGDPRRAAVHHRQPAADRADDPDAVDPRDTDPPPDPAPALLWATHGAQDEPCPVSDGEFVPAHAVIDHDHARTERMWLAGFPALSTTPPGRCRHPTGADGPPGATPAPRKGVVDLQIPLTTLIGLSRLPGELDGFGPVVADIARRIALDQPDATWRYSVYNPLGELIHHGTTRARPDPGAPPADHGRRHPTAAVAAFVRARDRTCVAPGCRRAARNCDIDHTTDWAHGGPTTPGNLGLLCRLHHLFKHATGSELLQPSPGVFRWKTPRNLQYLTRPDPLLIDDNELAGLPPVGAPSAASGPAPQQRVRPL